MKRIWQQLRGGRARVAAHPFFGWLNSDAVPLERRFVFAPVMIDFIMGFADLNKWFLSYEAPQNSLERAINEHTEEDRTHSLLFYENWTTLALGEIGSWTPGKMLWWMFHADGTETVRRFGMELLEMSVKHPDPLVRFPMMEAVEICGDVFFGHTAPIATRLSRERGVPHDYFGQYHRDRETGHLHTDETELAASILNDEQVSAATLVVQRVFDRFLRVLDDVHEYGRRAQSYDALVRDLEGEFLDATAPLRDRSAPPTPPTAPPPTATQSLLVSRLRRRVAQLERHPLLAWLREDGAVSPRDRLRGFMAIWGIDIAGYRDFNELVLRYPAPSSPLEEAITRWADRLASHGALYLRDWQALGMDRLLGWDAGEAIGFYFLTPQTETHRRNMAKVKHFAFRNEHPLVRWWLMKSLEATGEPLFACTEPLAAAVEAEDGVTLDYWANRHHLAHPAELALDPGADAAFLAESPTIAQHREIAAIIDTVFDNAEEQYSLSLREAQGQTFVRASRTLPPPRFSGFSPIAAEERTRDIG